MTNKDNEIYRSQYRLPKPVADWLKAQASAHFRSINAELLAIIHEAMQKDSPTTPLTGKGKANL